MAEDEETWITESMAAAAVAWGERCAEAHAIALDAALVARHLWPSSLGLIFTDYKRAGEELNLRRSDRIFLGHLAVNTADARWAALRAGPPQTQARN